MYIGYTLDTVSIDGYSSKVKWFWSERCKSDASIDDIQREYNSFEFVFVWTDKVENRVSDDESNISQVSAFSSLKNQFAKSSGVWLNLKFKYCLFVNSTFVDFDYVNCLLAQIDGFVLMRLFNRIIQSIRCGCGIFSINFRLFWRVSRLWKSLISSEIRWRHFSLRPLASGQNRSNHFACTVLWKPFGAKMGHWIDSLGST